MVPPRYTRGTLPRYPAGYQHRALILLKLSLRDPAPPNMKKKTQKYSKSDAGFKPAIKNQSCIQTICFYSLSPPSNRCEMAGILTVSFLRRNHSNQPNQPTNPTPNGRTYSFPSKGRRGGWWMLGWRGSPYTRPPHIPHAPPIVVPAL